MPKGGIKGKEREKGREGGREREREREGGGGRKGERGRAGERERERERNMYIIKSDTRQTDRYKEDQTTIKKLANAFFVITKGEPPTTRR